jgi:undecaprenyl-diphosphatase
LPLGVLLILAAACGIGAAAAARALLRREPAVPLFKVAGAILLVGGLVVATLAVLVAHTDVLHGIDQGAADWAFDHAGAISHRGLVLVTGLGETYLVLPLALVVAIVDLYRRGSYWALPFLLVVILGDKLLTQQLKQLVDRARPTLEPIAATLGPSFPSGHSSTAAASWAAFAFIAGLWWGRRSWPLLAGLAVGIAVAVAASRVLLDVHWLTDVVAGLALGWAWFAICALALGPRLRSPPPDLRPSRGSPGGSRPGR